MDEFHMWVIGGAVATITTLVGAVWTLRGTISSTFNALNAASEARASKTHERIDTLADRFVSRDEHEAHMRSFTHITDELSRQMNSLSERVDDLQDAR